MTLPTRPLFAPTDASPTFVLDVGLSLEWFVAVSGIPGSSRILNLLPTTVPLVPINWPSQIAEGVLALTRSGKATSERANRFLSGFDIFKFLTDARRLDHAWVSIYSTARSYRLRVGPAAALELAVRSQLPLATTDPKLLAVAPRAGVAIFTP